MALADDEARAAAGNQGRQPCHGAGVAGNDEPADTGRYRDEITMAVAAQHQADTAIEPAGRWLGSEEVSHAKEIRVPVAVDVGKNDSVDRRQLGRPRQRTELKRAIGLLEENAAGELGGGEAPRCLKPFGREDILDRGVRITGKR